MYISILQYIGCALCMYGSSNSSSSSSSSSSGDSSGDYDY